MDALGSRIAVVGSWHQSSVLAACLAELGHQVVGVAGEPALAGLKEGRAPLHEPGLDDLLQAGLHSGRLRFTGDYADGLCDVNFAYVSIDTPVGEDDDSDLDPIWNAVEQVKDAASAGTVIVVTSQVPVGTTQQIGERLKRPVAYVPEFLRLGTALDTFRHADRVVVGAQSPDLARRVAGIYRSLQRPLVVTDVRTAEMAKHACNSFLATSISFINQISDLCEQVGADIAEVGAIMRLDQRIGPRAFLDAGLGYAGGTLGREVQAFRRLGAAHGVATELFDAVDLVNRRRVASVVNRLKALHDDLRGAGIAVFGLTYKVGTSTLRRSASIELIGRLTAAGARVAAYDPLARTGEERNLPPFLLYREPAAALQGMSALVLMAPWPKDMPPRQAAELMSRPLVLDTGNHLDRTAARSAGFAYHRIGGE
jgi:UDPglucose 6-dehydrogenase